MNTTKSKYLIYFSGWNSRLIVASSMSHAVRKWACWYDELVHEYPIMQGDERVVTVEDDRGTRLMYRAYVDEDGEYCADIEWPTNTVIEYKTNNT